MKTLNFLPVVLLIAGHLLVQSASAQTPGMPETGPFSVQMFIGGTTNVYLCVNPPTTFTDGTPIPVGTPVEIRIYRSLDNGATYSTPVNILAGGSGSVGQGAAGSMEKPWIDITADVGVDGQPPYTVYLAASAVVGNVESPINVTNLTFVYYPDLTRFVLPSEAPGFAGPAGGGAGGGNPGMGGGSLAGTWNLNDQGTMTIFQEGTAVSGNISAQGASLGTISGTFENGTYNLRITFQAEGQVLDVGVVATVNGQTVTGTASLDGASYPLRLAIEGNRLRSI